MRKIRLDIAGLTSGQAQGSYTLILSEPETERKLPIIIGTFEAQAIAIEIEKITPFMPMTHDLFVSFTKAFNIEVKEVIIYNLHEGVFYAKIVCICNGETQEIDARTSDSIALAVRFKCPIFTYEKIMDEAAIVIDDELVETPARSSQTDNPPKPKSQQEQLASLSTEELEIKLEEAIRMEEYHQAALIRDELSKRKKN